MSSQVKRGIELDVSLAQDDVEDIATRIARYDHIVDELEVLDQHLRKRVVGLPYSVEVLIVPLTPVRLVTKSSSRSLRSLPWVTFKEIISSRWSRRPEDRQLRTSRQRGQWRDSIEVTPAVDSPSDVRDCTVEKSLDHKGD